MRAFIGMLIAGGLALSGAVATAGQAAAATPPKCSATSGYSCVEIDRRDSRINSVRVNGQCLYFNNSGTVHYFPNVTIRTDPSHVPSTKIYGGNRCQSNTGLNLPILGWQRLPNEYNYVPLTVG